MTTPPGPPQPGSPQPDPYQPGSQGQGPEGWPGQQPAPGQQWPQQPYPQQPQPQQPYPGATPYPQPGQAGFPPAGTPPVGGYPQPYPGGPYGPPPPKKRKLTWLWITLGVLAVLLVASIGLLAFASKDSVSDTEDVAVGDCIKVSGRSAERDLNADKVECSSEGFTFLVAEKVGAGTDACSDETYSRLWFVGGSDDDATREQLCLTPNLSAGKCYEIPESSPTAGLADFRVVTCGSPATKAGVAVYEVNSRTGGQPSCTDGQVEAYFALPRPTGYCLTEQ